MITAKDNGAPAVAAPAEDAKRELEGDIARVREAITRGLSRVVTEAGHHGVMYVYDWASVTGYGRQAHSEGQDLLLNAERCLQLAINHVRELRNDLQQQWDRAEGVRDPWEVAPPC